jgi:glycosyltransferase involved in cell wall biosynthesis
MKASVIVSAYNHARYVEQAVESAVSQRADFDYEVVVVDDASTDGTREIVMRCKEAHPDKIRLVLHPKNLGWGFSALDLVSLAQGEYVALLDGDDYWLDELKLQKQVGFLESHPGFSFCAHANQVLNEIDGSQFVRHAMSENRTLRLADILPSNIFHTGSLVFRRADVTEWPQAFAGLFFEDWALQVLLARKGDIMLLADVMSAYRVHKDGLWTSRYRGAAENGGVTPEGWKLILDFWKRLAGWLPAEHEPRLKELIAVNQRYAEPS